MKAEDIRPGMILKNKVSGNIGVLYTGCTYGCIESSMEVPIVYQGKDSDPKGPFFLGTPYEALELYKLKSEDILTEKHMKDVCKPGKDKETCCYLACGSDGFLCLKLGGTLETVWTMETRIGEGKSVANSNNCGGRFGSIKAIDSSAL